VGKAGLVGKEQGLVISGLESGELLVEWRGETMADNGGGGGDAGFLCGESGNLAGQAVPSA
jgi:hypothetical protein